jgi:ribonuclease P protein subunit POP4
MNVSPDIVRHEFVGTQAKVVRSCHQGNVGISGRIINETRNTFTLQHGGERKVMIKDSCVFHFSFVDRTTVEIDGTILRGRPEERLKKAIRRLW